MKHVLSHSFHARLLNKNHVWYTEITFHRITDKKLALKEAIVTNNYIKLYLVPVCFIETVTYHMRVSMGLTVSRKTAKNLAVRRKNERILTVSRKKC